MTLAQVILCHNTTIDQAGPSSSGVVDPSAYGGRGPFTVGERSTSHDPHIEIHMFMVCVQAYYVRGPNHDTSTMTYG